MPAASQTEHDVRELDIVIIGAGFAGLYALYRFREVLGLEARVFEKGDGVGGTWFWNRYPGARCDSLSFVYSYSFSSELEHEWTWSSKYPEQPEILAYLNHVADRFDLRRDIQLSTRVVSATFDEASSKWTVDTDHGERFAAPFLISAVGCLSAASLPDIPGRDRFEGEAYHTSEWPKHPVSFAGKARRPNRHRIDGNPDDPGDRRRGRAADRLPAYAELHRAHPEYAAQPRGLGRDQAQLRRDPRAGAAQLGRTPYDAIDRKTFEVSDEERQLIFEDLWEEGGFRFLWGSFRDIMTDRRANQEAAEFIRSKIRRS
jgi:hypothetical protein